MALAAPPAARVDISLSAVFHSGFHRQYERTRPQPRCGPEPVVLIIARTALDAESLADPIYAPP